MYYIDEIDMMGAFASICTQTGKNVGHVVAEKKEEVNLAVQLVLSMQKTAEDEGLLALEYMLEDIKSSQAPCADFLPDKIMMIVNGTYANIVTEIMINQFYVRNPDDFEAVILFIYMFGLEMIQQKVIEEIKGCFKMPPQECRELFRKILDLIESKG